MHKFEVRFKRQSGKFSNPRGKLKEKLEINGNYDRTANLS
jgi:hypothetical protein